MLNFTVGPVQIEDEILSLGKEQVPYFRTEEFSSLMKDNESKILSLFGAGENSRAVFMTGSGTASMEACVMNLFTKDDRLLVVNGGSFGKRLAELCSVFEIPFTEINVQPGKPLTSQMLLEYDGKGYTGFLVQLCETSTGVLFDMDLISDFCKRNNAFLFVDAISGFLCDPFSMEALGVGAAITGSQKALALPPGVSIICLSSKAVDRCQKNKVHSLYFNLADYLKNGERGQTPFTPAVSILLQLNKRLSGLSKDGGRGEMEKISLRAKYFRECIKNLPFRIFTDSTCLSNCVTALETREGFSAHALFERLKDQYGIWICPNGGDLRERVFRVGHIGNLTKDDYDKLIQALEREAK